MHSPHLCSGKWFTAKDFPFPHGLRELTDCLLPQPPMHFPFLRSWSSLSQRQQRAHPSQPPNPAPSPQTPAATLPTVLTFSPARTQCLPSSPARVVYTTHSSCPVCWQAWPHTPEGLVSSPNPPWRLGWEIRSNLQPSTQRTGQ